MKNKKRDENLLFYYLYIQNLSRNPTTLVVGVSECKTKFYVREFLPNFLKNFTVKIKITIPATISDKGDANKIP